jgi:hypothetical protein
LAYAEETIEGIPRHGITSHSPKRSGLCFVNGNDTKVAPRAAAAASRSNSLYIYTPGACRCPYPKTFLKDYRLLILERVSSVPLIHWDIAIRYLAAEGLSRLSLS